MMMLAPQDAVKEHVACRACGATHAGAHKGNKQKSSFGLCENCVSDFYVQNGNKRFTSKDLSGLLTSRLKNTIERKNRGKIVGRCEAITSPYSGGHQCAQHAQTFVLGRRVCSQHARSKLLQFTTDTAPNGTSVVINQIRLLAEQDKTFAKALASLFKEPMNNHNIGEP